MKRKITVEPYGYDFIRATLYRKTFLFWHIEQRCSGHKAYIDDINRTVEYWRQAKEMPKSQIIHRGFGGKHTIFTEAYFYIRGWYFTVLLKRQIRQANALCRLTRKKVYVMPNEKGFPRVVQSNHINVLKRQGVIKKDASAIDFDRECLYKIEFKNLNEHEQNI
jgi:hypothetical protein